MSKPSRLPGDPKHSHKTDVRSKSVREERRTAALLGARTTPNSGAGSFISSKGDIRGERYLIEHKMTDKASIRVGVTAVEKICREAALLGKKPAIAMTIEGMPDGFPRRWVAIPLLDFVELTGGSV